MAKKFFVTVIIPTYNNSDVLSICLEAIRKQDYKDYEIICVDGGSTDSTKEIIKKFDAILLLNPKKIEEHAKPIALKKAKGDLILLVDADNVMPHNKWMSKMVSCFEDSEIVGADTYYYGYFKDSNIFTKYASLTGGDDPIPSYLGINDRYCYFTNKWTGMPNITEDKGEYFKTILTDENKIPAMGSNGFMVRKSALQEIDVNPYIHTVVIYDLVKKGYNKFGKTKDYLVHIQGGFKGAIKKKIRRMKRRKTNEVTWRYKFYIPTYRVVLLSLYIILILPVLIDTVIGFFRKRTIAWILHPVMTFVLFFIYAYYTIKR